ncbi:MAG: hypothetical protein U0X75_03165 [Acidobacteriota bacterium]
MRCQLRRVFTGAARFLEISVLRSGVGVFTALRPRRHHALRHQSGNAGAANDTGGVCRLRDQHTNSRRWRASATPRHQAGANFNIGGNGTVGGNLIANSDIWRGTTPTYKLDVAGNLRPERLEMTRTMSKLPVAQMPGPASI